MSIREILKELEMTPYEGQKYVVLSLGGEDEEGVDIYPPYLVYHLWLIIVKLTSFLQFLVKTIPPISSIWVTSSKKYFFIRFWWILNSLRQFKFTLMNFLIHLKWFLSSQKFQINILNLL